MVGLLALQLADALIQPVDLFLGALADGALGLAIVCAFAGELLGREVGDAARVGLAASLLTAGLLLVLVLVLVLMLAVICRVSLVAERSVCRCIALSRRRHLLTKKGTGKDVGCGGKGNAKELRLRSAGEKWAAES